ncbi:MAG TPA: amino acid adenylation domain-containing protein [Pyrinomonadaceae bacterium]|nr:amino acid adenylation domain-containing protein [Pyrinomonadaceae bacterium]
MTIGRGLWNTRLYILDGRGEPIPEGVAGEVWVAGEGLARGYWGRAGQTAERFRPDPFSHEPGGRMYRTGDVGRFVKGGEVEYLGRGDEQVKVRGFRIELGEIEAALVRHRGVEQAVVVAREEAGGDKRLVAYVVAADGQAPSADELRRHVKESLPEYMVPSSFVTLGEVPLTPNGKVNRRALPAPDNSRRESVEAFAAPSTEVERLLAGIWSHVLGVEQVGSRDNFFELGGHSLLATRVVARAREAFGVELSLHALFESPTVAELSRRIEEARAEGTGPALEPVARAPREGDLPLSFAQQRLWLLEQLEADKSTYNIPVAVRFVGALDAGALGRSLDEILRRHESLRTRFVNVAGEPSQVIEPESGVVLEVRDLAALPEGEREAEALRLMTAEARLHFDVSRGPLLRAALLRLRPEEHVVVLVMHHIISDGWSLGVLVRELVALYEAFTKGEPSPLAELPVQYVDYACWQRGWLNEHALGPQLEYWERQLAGAPTRLELPTDRPRPAVQSFRGATHAFTLPPSLSSAIKRLSREHSATPFMLLLSAFYALLGRYTSQSDILVGTPVANRTRPEIEPLIGFFVNTLVLRADLSDDPTFLELLTRVRQTALDAYAHQDLPFEKLVEALRPERALSHTPLFQVMFVHQEATAGLKLPGLEIETLEVKTGTAKFEQTWAVVESGDGSFEVKVEYNADLFDADTVGRMTGHYRNLLEAAVADLSLPVSELALMDDGERRLLLEEWGRGASCPPGEPRPVHELFAEQVRRQPRALAVECGVERLSYAELDHRARGVSRRLRAAGVGRGDLVGVCMERGAAMVAALLGVLKAGAAYVPVDAATPRRRVEELLRDAGVKAVVCDEATAELVAGAGAKVLHVGGEVLSDEAAGVEDEAKVSGEDLAYVIYTSGSTGKPKGVAIQHDSLFNLVRWHRDAYQVTEDDRATQLAGPAFDASVWELWSYLTAGASVFIPSQEIYAAPPKLVAWLAEKEITMCFLPTPLAETVLDEAWPEGMALRFLFTGGDRLHKAAPPSAPFTFVNLYGPTENTVITTSGRVAPSAATPDAAPHIGRPVDNVEVYLLDSQLRPVPAGVAGELHIGGGQLARCYLNRPALTAEKFIPNPFAREAGARLYKTGDAARFLADGNIEFLGRLDQQVKVRGFRIELGEIETILLQHPSVAEAVVLTREDVRGDARLVAYVVAREGAELPAGELRCYLKERLPEYMVPSAFVVLDSLPLTPNGKVDRRALPEPDTAAAEDEYVAPRTAAEEILAGIWAEVLRVEKVGVRQNFFELGGHSLLATRIVAKIQTAFQIDLPLRTLFESPTVEGLAEAVEKALRAGEGVAASPITRRTSEGGLSFAQQRLWFLNRLEPNNSAYNIPIALGLSGRLDEEALARALDEIVRRHEVLRASFAEEDGRPLQVISPSATLRLDVVDLSDVAAGDARSAEVRRLTEEEARRPFDLERAPLMRATLVRLGDEDHVLLITMHHIISDGWSVGVFTREVAALYRAFAEGEAARLAELPIQYPDFAEWQRRWMAGGVLETQLEYWKKQLAGIPPVLELPTDYPRPAVQTFSGARRTLELSPALSKSLNALARQESATLFITLLSAFSALLHRYTSQADILVGTPVANRTRPELEGLIGFFVNTLVLRADLSDDPTFLELLRRTRQTALEAYAHQDLPFEKLVEALRPERALSHTPLFQVMFNMLNLQDERVELPGLKMQMLAGEGAASKFDLTLYARERGEAVGLELVYNAHLFTDERMGLMLEAFERLLAQLVERPEERVTRHTLLGASSEALLPNPSSPLPPAWEGSVHERFRQQARRVPDRTAVADKHGAWTYLELDVYSDRLAARLRAGGVERGDPVAIYAQRGGSLVLAMLGVLKAGAAFVILDPANPTRRLLDCLAAARPSAWIEITGGPAPPTTLAESLSASPLKCRVELPHGASAARASLADCPAFGGDVSVGPDDAAYVAFTSGSTGGPKGIVGSHRPLGHFLRWHSETFGLGEADRFSMLSGLAHDPLLRDVFTPLWLGATLCVPDAEDTGRPEAMADWMARERVSVAHLTPAMGRLLAGRDGTDEHSNGHARSLPSLRYAFFGGDVLTARDVEGLKRLAPSATCVNFYGTTETPQAMGFYVVPDGVEGAAELPLGGGIDGVQLLVLNDARRLAGVGELGEIYVRTPYLSKGYLGDGGLTRERFLANPFTRDDGDLVYKTGDLGRYLPDGRVAYLGRRDSQVKLRGFRIELREIEAALSALPGVGAAAVMLREDAPGDRRLAAYLVAKADEAPTISRLRARLKETLPEYMLPSALVVLDRLPLTPNGKVDYRALPAPENLRPQLAEDYVAPQSGLERTIAAVWQDVLKVERVGVHDNFFDLGGHSLLVVQVNSRLRKELDRDISLVEMFRYPSVSALAAFLSRKQEEATPAFARVDERAKKAKAAMSQRRRTAAGRRGNE